MTGIVNCECFDGVSSGIAGNTKAGAVLLRLLTVRKPF